MLPIAGVETNHACRIIDEIGIGRATLDDDAARFAREYLRPLAIASHAFSAPACDDDAPRIPAKRFLYFLFFVAVEETVFY